MNIRFNFIEHTQMPQMWGKLRFSCRCGANIPGIDQLKNKIWHSNDEPSCSYLRYWQNKTTDCWKGECGLYNQICLAEHENFIWPLHKVLGYVNVLRLIDCIDAYIQQFSLMDMQSLENIEHQKTKIYAHKWIDQKLSYRFIGIHLGVLLKQENIAPFYISNWDPPHLPPSPLFHNFPGRRPTFVIYNHTLTAAQPKTAWASLEKAWETMRPGDHLVVKDLTADCIEARAVVQKNSEMDGIVEFHREGQFYRSALSENFSSFVQNRLPDVLSIYHSISHTYPNSREKAFGTSYSVFQKNSLLKIEDSWEEAIGSFEEFQKTDKGILGFLATKKAAQIVAKKRGVDPETLFDSKGLCFDYEVGYEAQKLRLLEDE